MVFFADSSSFLIFRWLHFSSLSLFPQSCRCSCSSSSSELPSLELSLEDSSMKSARRSRTKIRKPKFLSLRVVLSPENLQRSAPMSPSDHDFSNCQDHQQQLNLFPLHPENLIEDKEIHEENVAFILNSASSDSSLHGLLPTAGHSTSSEEEALSFAYRGSYSAGNGTSCSLLRSAMRSRERDASDEKWVSYSEVVEWKEVEEVSSCAADIRRNKGVRGLLSLKLDYDGILNAWSDQAPLFIKGEFPQTVPDLQDDHYLLQLDHLAIGVVDGWRSNRNVWKVPEMEGSMKMEEDKGGKEGWKTAQREASVLRYKEKRQSRLFAKRIRYEVRKLNAEKRPRLKGRFVKRD